MQQYLVKPSVADVNENVLSEQLVEESALTEELVKNAGQPLEAAIREVLVLDIHYIFFRIWRKKMFLGFRFNSIQGVQT